MTSEQEKQVALRTSTITLAICALLSVTKFTLGIVSGSGALVADSVHSFSDVLTTVAVMVGFQLSKKAPDRRHPYGHDKIESMVGIALSLVLLGTALGIGIGGIEGIRTAISGGELTVPTAAALVGAALSIVIPELLYRYSIAKAKLINSSSMEADAWHHRSDAFSSVGTLIGVAGARMGYPILDPLASLVICGFIIAVAARIFIKGIAQTIDQAIDEATEEEIRSLVLSFEGVRAINEMRTRQAASRMFIDVSIACDAGITLEAAHTIAEKVHLRLEASYSTLLHCNVHVDPYYE